MQRLTSNVLEYKESCMMQLADTESCSLREGIAQGSVNVPSESDLVVNDHLSSLDAWFDEVISGDQGASNPVNPALEASDNEDSAARSSLLKTLTDLSALTNELLVVCESTSDPEILSNSSLAEESGHSSEVNDQQVKRPVGTTNEVKKMKQKETTSNEVIQLRYAMAYFD
ncbi:hypothetical protein P3T76_001223 [Phytophthora citrophthora]|uniref:Uncharacterized protein n=1 Tax=Phytophthora citrophthora TaxID=4793 RepID=A0AAD9LRT6_9STRA|nr:hypothetical protein P3T76_001223 [Phytophthora citrophthora]